MNINVTSEIGNLKAVLLHRPGKELEKLTPDLLESLLFDDIPWLKEMQNEHDEFAEILRSRGAAVYYIERLLADVLEDKDVKKKIINDSLSASRIQNPRLRKALYDKIIEMEPNQVAEIAIAGLAKNEIELDIPQDGLWDYVHKDYPLYINPAPNLYFTRDPAAVIGDGISINTMKTETRRRESGLVRYLYENHPIFESSNGKLWYDNDQTHNIEGGDILVLSEKVVAIGCSQRTSSAAIETLAAKLFSERKTLREVLAIHIPALRAFMHLDTVFTMVDYDSFTIFPGIQDKINVYKLERDSKKGIKVTPEKSLLPTLKKSLGLPAVKLIQSGGGDAITAAREQWNDSTNTLAIAPGVVVTYSRNERSNDTLRKNGIEVLEVGGSELVRGRGGPRCMSCPLIREPL